MQVCTPPRRCLSGAVHLLPGTALALQLSYGRKPAACASWCSLLIAGLAPADEDTDGHVDNFACFVAPAKVLLAWTDDESDPQVRPHGLCTASPADPAHRLLTSEAGHIQQIGLRASQYVRSKAAYDVLAASTDAKGRRIEVVKMPVPPPQHLTEVTCMDTGLLKSVTLQARAVPEQHTTSSTSG